MEGSEKELEDTGKDCDIDTKPNAKLQKKTTRQRTTTAAKKQESQRRRDQPVQGSQSRGARPATKNRPTNENNKVLPWNEKTRRV